MSRPVEIRYSIGRGQSDDSVATRETPGWFDASWAPGNSCRTFSRWNLNSKKSLYTLPTTQVEKYMRSCRMCGDRQKVKITFCNV